MVKLAKSNLIKVLTLPCYLSNGTPFVFQIFAGTHLRHLVTTTTWITELHGISWESLFDVSFDS